MQVCRARRAPIADRMAVKILVGDGDDFRGRLDSILLEIRDFNNRFVTQATEFLVTKLYEWGFERKESVTGAGVSNPKPEPTESL